jgi:phage terminase large subunit-like protein
MNDSLQELYKELIYRRKWRKIDFIFPDKGQNDLTNSKSTWSRELFPKHLEFMSLGSKYRQRWLSAGNRVGKTLMAAYEVTCHLTGEYPSWWTGKRFDGPSDWWIVGQTSQTVQQILQEELLGPIGEFGSGMVPLDKLDLESLPSASKAGVAVQGFKVKHKSGGFSTVGFKSIESGILAFTGTAKSVWIDEPVPLNIYTELLTRTTTGDNILIVTATPITGLTDCIVNFCNGEFKYGEIDKFRHMHQISWDDAPHLSEESKQNLWNSVPPYQRDARKLGIPVLGAGAVFPVSEESYTCPPFELPPSWKKIIGMDVGWRCTAATFLAINPDTGECYVYSEYSGGELTPNQHAVNIKARCKSNITVAIDPAAHSRSQTDGQIIFDQLEEMGLDLVNADNAVESGLWTLLELLQNGKLKVFSTCRNLIKDIARSARDTNGKLVDKSSFHMLDSFRYAVMTRELAKSETIKKVGGQFSNNRW